MRQRGVTIITEIKADKLTDLKELLNEINSDIPGNRWIDFNQLNMVHILRWVILPGEEVAGKVIPPQLVLSTNFDGKLLPHLEELVSRCSEGIRAIYSHCEGCPKGTNRQSMVTYFLQHRVKTSAFYVGAMGSTVEQIKRESQLMKDIQEHLENYIPQQDRNKKSPREFQVAMTERFYSQPGNQWIWEKTKPLGLVRFGPLYLGLLGVLALGIIAGTWFLSPIIGMILTSLILLIIGSWFIALRIHEKKDARNYAPSVRDGQLVSHHGQKENYPVQNQISHLASVKPGFFRQVTLRFILSAINLLTTLIFNKGNLNGIHSIHFARWVLIDNGRRLLFFSNYDGSWESYLGEFVDRAFMGLTAVWCNTQGFPPAKYLMFGGARKSKEFKAWSRAHQIETQVWYSAYHLLSLNNVLNNTTVRQKLVKSLNEDKFQEFLQRV